MSRNVRVQASLAAAAGFLLALADFDRRRGWEQLGHASLFAFLTRELGPSNAAAWYRLTGARLLPSVPAVEAALRNGRLCLTVVGELSRVLTSANAEEVLPRFFGRSSREAKEIVAALLPDPAPPRRDVVRALPAPVPAAHALATGPLEEPSAVPLRAREVVPTQPAQDPGAELRPLTDELRRLSVAVSARFIVKLAAARTGLSHALPGATTEQILETALDLLLERQARRKALVRRPRKTRSAPPASTLASTSAPTSTSTPVVALAGRPHIPSEIEREVRLRDGDRCQFPLDAGGVCGSTWQVQLDHVRPLATGARWRGAQEAAPYVGHPMRIAPAATATVPAI